MPLLEKASQLRDEARIVNHSSIARFQTKRLKEKFLEKKGGNLGGDGGNLMFGGGRWERYAQTKPLPLITINLSISIYNSRGWRNGQFFYKIFNEVWAV